MTRSLIKQFDLLTQDMILTPRRLKELYGHEDAHLFDDAVFKVNEGGEYQNEFLTVWPIIRTPKLLNDIAKTLAARLMRMRQRTQFNRIVTCSPTMRYVMEEISHILPAKADVTFEYLGLHPMQGMDLVASRPFSERDHVAIITDVVSSGELLREMINVVGGARATVVGSLAMFRTRYLDADELAGVPRFESVRSSSLSRDNQNNSLFQANLLVREGDPSAVAHIAVDRATVYPVDVDASDSDFTPHLLFETLLAVQRDVELLSLGTFRSNDKWMSLGINIEALLKQLEGEISAKVLEAFELETAPRLRGRKGSQPSRRLTIVTTPGRENRLFAGFLERQLQKHLYNCRMILIPRSESLSEQYSYFAPARVEFEDDEQIFLCLATVSTSEKLRALAAFLAMSGGRHIKVLTLLNRMNNGAGSFLSRVLNLQSGKERQPRRVKLELHESYFHYSSFFKLYDLSTSDLIRARQIALQTIEDYVRETESVFYQAQARNELKYFEPLDMFRSRGALGCTVDLSIDSDAGNHDPAETKLQAELRLAGIDPTAVPEAVAYALCLRDLQQDGDVALLRRLILITSSKELTYALVRLVLLNASILDVQGFFGYLIYELLNTITVIENEKRDATDAAVAEGALQDLDQFRSLEERLSKLVEHQIRCMSVLTFISRLRVRGANRSQAMSALRTILTIGETEADALRAFMSANDLLFLWSITCLANAFGIRKSLEEPAQDFVRVLTDQMQGVSFATNQLSIAEHLDDLFPASAGQVGPQSSILPTSTNESDEARSLIQQTHATLIDFELFFTEKSEVQSTNSLPKILQKIERSLFPYPFMRHSFNFNQIRGIHGFLKSRVISHAARNSTYVVSFKNWPDREEIKNAINRCLIALGDMLRTEADVGRLIDLRLETESWSTYFSNSYGDSHFAIDIKSLQIILQTARTDYEMWPGDLTSIKEYADAITANVWRPDAITQCESDLYTLIRRHSFKMRDVIEEAMHSANRKLVDSGFRDNVDKGKFSGGQIWALDRATCNDLDFVALGDARDIMEAIENALWNVKHAPDALDRDEGRMIECGRIARNGSLGEFVIRITTYGKRFEKLVDEGERAPTYQDQARKLRLFDGDFSYTQAPGRRPGAQAVIRVAETPFLAISPSDHPWRNS